MCGFVFSSSLPSDALKQGFETLTHRGPDHQSLTTEYGCTWGFHRLSIMDLSDKGNQPFQHCGVQLVCNGEIYNYQTTENLARKRLHIPFR
ncbi:hypothetical protein ACLSYX_11125 [[Pasteurella] aerogenes]